MAKHDYDNDYEVDLENAYKWRLEHPEVAYPKVPRIICSNQFEDSVYDKELKVFYYEDNQILNHEFMILDDRINKRSKKVEFFVESRSSPVYKMAFWICAEWVVHRRPKIKS